MVEDGKVKFNEQEQAEVNRLIDERFGRENVHELKGIVEELKTWGYEGTPAEIRAAVKQQAEMFKQQQAEADKQAQLDALKEQAKDEGTSPELLKEIKSLKDELAEIKGERMAQKQAEIKQKKTSDQFNKQVEFFQKSEETKGIDLEKLQENPKFMKFLSRQKPTGKDDYLVEVYKDFVDLVGGAEAEALAKMQANIERSTSSGKNKGNTGGTYGLTPNQQKLADENGMSYKDYAAGLNLITKG
jgi:hypothetical protein